MIPRMDNFKHFRERFEIIAENIAKILGPLSVSPCLSEIHEEFFDWLEANVWGDIFNRYYLHGSQSISGWRKIRSGKALRYCRPALIPPALSDCRAGVDLKVGHGGGWKFMPPLSQATLPASPTGCG